MPARPSSEDIRLLRERISSEERGGLLPDIDFGQMIADMREERDDEIVGRISGDRA